ncbi:MAG: cytochrome d ubiquinol oxidase subunit II [Candidatus Nanohaloarchaea archaeon]
MAVEHLFGMPLPEIWFMLVFFLLAMFLALDGFDFGVGMLFLTRRKLEEKEEFMSAIGPLWDGNEVWIVVFGGALFAVFPSVYGSIFGSNYLLVFGILFALTLRSLAPEFFKDRDSRLWRKAWGAAFVTGSFFAPFILGMFLDNWLTGTPSIGISDIVFGSLIVMLSLVEGAGFLLVKTRDELREEVRGYCMYILAVFLLLYIPSMIYLQRVLALDMKLSLAVLMMLPLASTSLATYLVHSESYGRGFYIIESLAFEMVALFAYILYPVIDPLTGTTVTQAAVPPLELNIMTVSALGLIPLILVYFLVLYPIFSGKVEDENYEEVE